MRSKLYILAVIAVIVGMLVPATAFAQDGNPPRRGLVAVDNGGEVSSDQHGAQTTGMVDVVVHLNKLPLASVDKDMTPEERVAYAASVAELQDQVAAQVEALGGTVIGRFETLSSGLAVTIDAANVEALRGLANVVAVRKVNNYEVDLNNTVPFIGAADVQAMGLDGTGVKVAVLDDGVDYTHAKLGGSGDPADYAACAANPTIISPTNCGNFFPNAKVAGGYDFVGSDWTGAAGSPPTKPDPNPIALSFHGTHVSDIIAGLPAGGVRGGVAPGAKLWMFKVCSEKTSACNGPALLLATDRTADLDGNPATIDPADVINASIGGLYGQPEDDWTAFVNAAVARGSIYVISAGNDSDKPYIVSSASTATGAISVAQTSVPTDKRYFIRINAPLANAGQLITDTAFLDWSVPLETSGPVTGDLVYDTTNADTRLGCKADGSSPWTAGQYADKVLLVDRGVCAASLKAANASAAGAKLVIIAMIAPGAPYPFAFGGGTVTIPAFSVTQADGAVLKAAGTNVTMNASDPNLVLSLLDTMVGTSARGPRNHDGDIKPDIGAPGGSVSAEFGTGTGTTPFGGTSGAAPMVSGSAALLVQKYGKSLSVQAYKALLMNTANTTVYQDFFGGTLAPITRIGGGRVDVLKAATSNTIAWDETYGCLDPRFRTGSMSFGYQAVTGGYVAMRRGVVTNLSDKGRWYDLSASFRYADDENKGVSLTVIPKRLYVPKNSDRPFFVKLRVNAKDLRPWNPDVNKGYGGNLSAPLTTQEYDGYVNIDGGAHNTVHLAWQILPKKAAAVMPKPGAMRFGADDTQKTLGLRNRAKFQDGDVDVFALVDRHPDLYFYQTFSDLPTGNSSGDACTSAGLPTGCAQTRIGIKEVGVRDYAGVYTEFGLTIHDHPFRAGQYPVELDVYVDSNMDGKPDYLVFNSDLNGNGSDGRNVVWACSFATGTCTAYFYTDSGFNTQNWILTVPAAAIGVQPGQQFNFRIEAFDAYFTLTTTDCSPGDCTSFHTYTMGKPKFAVNNLFPTVPAAGQVGLNVTRVPGGDTASPSQIGLLLMYRQAHIERESDSVLIKP